MTTLDQLEALADVSEQLRCDYVKNISPQTIKQLIALCRIQNAALKLSQVGSELGDFLDTYEMPFAVCKDLVAMEEALAAFDAFNGRE